MDNTQQLPAEWAIPADKVEFMKEAIKKLKASNRSDYESGDFDITNHKQETRYKTLEEVLQWLNPATEYASKFHELQTKYDNILATESGHESKTENVWQSGYASGHEAATGKVQQEIAQLKLWKMEATELLTPIHAYVHKNMEVSLGQCNVKLVLDRCKQYETARTLLSKFISRHEAGLLPDRFIYDEIKTFLDGTK